jgi:hypothetical protein
MQMTKKHKPARKKLTAKKSLAKKKVAPKKASARNRQIQWKNQSVDTVTVALEELEIISGEQSGDLQGLSNVECASSESVDELLEEGNAFEAEVVMGVEDAEDADEAEVRTHEVPQDDVPAEYLDKES